MDFRGKNVTLIGLGTRTHISLARYLARKGARITISDAKPRHELQEEINLLGDLPVALSLGGHKEEAIAAADVVFVSPGVPRDLPLVIEAQRRGIPVTSEIELVFEICPVPIIGITGSSGKTTTTALVGEILKADGRTVFVGGNIGVPLIDRIDDISPDADVVLELSSFQLESLKRSPHIAAILNITPNHLDRHKSFANYVTAKKNIIKHQNTADHAILNLDNSASSELAQETNARVLLFSRLSEVREGAFIADGELMVRLGGLARRICAVKELKLRGDHNVENALAAAAVATAAGVPPSKIAQVLTSFAGVEHRLELVREIDGVRFYNDSIATSPERTLAGLLSFSEPIVLLAGGMSKHLPLDELIRAILCKVRHLVLFGELGKEIEQAVHAADANGRIPMAHFPTLEQAIYRAAEVAVAGDVVLLSPGGTSFDEFKDFEHRGRFFKQIVNSLPAGKGCN